MNLEFSAPQSLAPKSGAVAQRPDSVRLPTDGVQFGPKVEQCEFERLLQRAMQILNARDLGSQLNAASASRA